ncbi:MAG: alpha/beta hydrolase, partial [Gammaproteobacteria bacterium]
MQLEQWRQAGSTFEFRGQPIFYRESGEGPALLCLHGFPTASWDWVRVWPELASGYRVIAPDLLGFGFSAKPHPHGYSIIEQADLVEKLLRERGVEEVHLLAHDYGDTVAQELLARQAGRRTEGLPGLTVRSALLLNGGLFPEAIRPLMLQRLLPTRLGPLIARLVTRAGFGSQFGRVFSHHARPGRMDMDAFWKLITSGRGRRVMPAISRYQRERVRRRKRWVDALSHAGVPLRLVVGTLDPVSGRSIADRYRQLVDD